MLLRRLSQARDDKRMAVLAETSRCIINKNQDKDVKLVVGIFRNLFKSHPSGLFRAVKFLELWSLQREY